MDDALRAVAAALASLAADTTRVADRVDRLAGTVGAHWHGHAAVRARHDIARHAAGVRAVASVLLVVADALVRCASTLDAVGPVTPDLLGVVVAPVPTLVWTAHEHAARVAAAADAMRLCDSALQAGSDRCDAVASAARYGAGGGSAAASWAATLDRTNRARLADRLGSWSAGHGSSVDRARQAAHDVDLRVAAALRRTRVDPVSGRGVPVLLLAYDPTAWSGRGRVEIAYGDPSRAQDVAYVVPGLGTRADPHLDGFDETAWQVYVAARTARVPGRAGPVAPRTTATVAWLGYRTPDVPQVAFAHRAVVGARALAAEVASLRRSRGEEQPHVTVVGHSYGSVVAGVATRRRAGDVDDLVLVGSPGAGADRADGLGVTGGHVWVGAAGSDEVSHLSRFGTDPAAAAFGAHRFPAEPSAAATDGAHSGYLAVGSQSLAAVGLVVASHGGAVPYVPGRTDHGFAGTLLPFALPPLVAAPSAPWLVRLPPTFGDPAAEGTAPPG
jgi:hypothetical protein